MGASQLTRDTLDILRREAVLGEGLEVPDLTWRPSRANLVVDTAVAAVAAVAYAPWWTSDPVLGVQLTIGSSAVVLTMGVVIPRKTRVIAAHIANRGGEATGSTAAAIIGTRWFRDWPPEALFLSPLALIIAFVLSPGDRSRWVSSAVVGLVMLGMLGAISFAAWNNSPWFRVRWYLMLATWCPARSRVGFMMRALQEDPR